MEADEGHGVIALLLAAYLHRPAPLVELVYTAGGLDAVALVASENPKWIPWLEVPEKRGHTSFGLFMLDDEWHPQFRYDLGAHIAYGAAFLAEMKATYPGFANSVSHYNGGKHPGEYSRAWGKTVLAKRGELQRVVWMEVYK